jgi:hypothetical protein
MIDEDTSLHFTDSTPTSDCNAPANWPIPPAHILTNSTRANLQTLVPPRSRPTAFPNSYSSPIRPQILVSPISPRADLLPVACSSPARSFQPGAKERHNTARQVTISSRFPHIRRMHNRAYTPHASGSSMPKSLVGYGDQFHQQGAPHMHEKSMSQASMRCKADPCV